MEVCFGKFDVFIFDLGKIRCKKFDFLVKIFCGFYVNRSIQEQIFSIISSKTKIKHLFHDYRIISLSFRYFCTSKI